jgi:opacity protein-like surface antigen
MSQARLLERSIKGRSGAGQASFEKAVGKFCAPAFSVAALAGFALCGSPALAQEQPNTQSVQIYGGELFGDDLTKTSVSGLTPRLDDNVTFGARYNYSVTDVWGIQLSAGYTPTRASRVVSGNSELGLTTADLDAVLNITPDSPLVVYALAGMGYAWSHLSAPIEGQVYGGPETIRDSNDFTANAGLGAKYYVTSNFFVDLEGRYRYLNRLLNTSGQSLNTVETTLGFGWRF